MSETPSHNEVRRAVGVITDYLRQEWVSEGCGPDYVLGCGSCAALMLIHQLHGLEEALDDAALSEGEAK